MSLLIKNGIIIDPCAETRTVKDILVEHGKIALVGENLTATDAEVLDATDKLVTPGLVDMHVHLREPGFEAKETVRTGTLAALKGGFTSVACMPNTYPVADNAPVIRYILGRAQEAGNAKVYPVGAITKNSEGSELAPMAELKEAGAVAFSDDGKPVSNSAVMRRAMEYAKMLDAVIISHCEESSLAGGVMHEGTISTMLGLKGIPSAAEEVMVARDVILAQLTGCRLHIAHVSTAGTVQIIREAKSRGAKVTAETTPHHFTLTHDYVHGYDTVTKVNPPLRTPEDVEAILAGLADGTIDVIATDHAPHTEEEKNVEYDLAPFGLVGLETAVGLVWSQLVIPGFLTAEQAVAKLSINPARLLGVSAGSLEVGAPADITIIEPHQEWEVNPESFASKGKNTPFAGRKLTGKPVMTLVNGTRF